MAEPVQDPGPVNEVLTRNIEALAEKRRDADRRASLEDRIAAVISAFAGSLAFVWLHLAILILWVAINLGLVPALNREKPDYRFHRLGMFINPAPQIALSRKRLGW